MGAWHWLTHALGVDYGLPYGHWGAYNFWSGFGSDVGEFGIFGGMAVLVRHRNCEVKGCWRLGRHRTAAGQRVCRVHHPDDHLTAARVREQHHAALRARKDGTT